MIRVFREKRSGQGKYREGSRRMNGISSGGELNKDFPGGGVLGKNTSVTFSHPY